MSEKSSLNEYTKDVILTVGIFSSIEDASSQDAVLHRVFGSLTEDALTCNLGPLRIIEVIVTLYRLYFSDGWSPARTFFYMISGVLLNKDDPRANINEKLTESLYDNFVGIKVPMLDPRTITGEADKHCCLLNKLWFNASAFDDENDSEDSEETESEGEESEEEMPSDESVESVDTEEGVVDPRLSSMPQWNSDSEEK